MRASTAVTATALLALLALTGGPLHVAASYCTGGPDPHSVPNLQPVLDGSEVTLIGQTTNGKIFTSVPDASNVTFRIVHVYGSYYDMGYAHGALVKEMATEFVDDVWREIEANVPNATQTLDALLEATRPHTLDSFFTELKGLSDATGIDYKTLQRVHVYPELSGAHCSMFGAWGSATPDGNLVQLRALDYSTAPPFRNHAAVIVYHPSEAAVDPATGQVAHAWANVAFTGFIGSITGYSSSRVAVSEIGVSNPDDTFGKQSYDGTPFSFLLRDVLQYDASLSDAVERIQDASRTCDLILGVGDGKLESRPFRGFQVSHSVCNVFDDTNMMPRNDTWHARIPDVVYWGMDWLCPGWSGRLMQQMNYLHGNVTAENTIREIVSLVQTGSLHVAVHDFAAEQMFVSFHVPDGFPKDAPQKAYERSFTRLDMRAMFAEKL